MEGRRVDMATWKGGERRRDVPYRFPLLVVRVGDGIDAGDFFSRKTLYSTSLHAGAAAFMGMEMESPSLFFPVNFSGGNGI